MGYAGSEIAEFNDAFPIKKLSLPIILPLLFLILLLSSPTPGQADDGTTPGQFTISSLNRHLNITAPYSGDADMDNSLVIEWDEDGGDTVYSDGKLYTLTRPIILRAGGTRNYRFYAADGALNATGSPSADKTVTLQACGSRPAVDPNGTYFEAENFTSTLVQGSTTFSVTTTPAGYNGTGMLYSGYNTNLGTPPTQQGKEYELDFPTAGTYTIWLAATMTTVPLTIPCSSASTAAGPRHSAQPFKIPGNGPITSRTEALRPLPSIPAKKAITPSTSGTANPIIAWMPST